MMAPDRNDKIIMIVTRSLERRLEEISRKINDIRLDDERYYGLISDHRNIISLLRTLQENKPETPLLAAFLDLVNMEKVGLIKIVLDPTMLCIL